MKKTAEQVLKHIIGLFIEYLEELQRACDEMPENDFVFGEKTAYVECLELIQDWESADEFGLDFDLEERFTLLS